MTADALQGTADEMADVQQALMYVLFKRERQTLDAGREREWLGGLALRLRTIANRCDPSQRNPNKEIPMNGSSLSNDLRNLAQNASKIMGRVAVAPSLPEPLRAGITDRVLQLSSLLDLLAHQIDVSNSEQLPADTPQIVPWY